MELKRWRCHFCGRYYRQCKSFQGGPPSWPRHYFGWAVQLIAAIRVSLLRLVLIATKYTSTWSESGGTSSFEKDIAEVFVQSLPVCNKDYKLKSIKHPEVIQNNNSISVCTVHYKSKFTILSCLIKIKENDPKVMFVAVGCGNTGALSTYPHPQLTHTNSPYCNTAVSG